MTLRRVLGPIDAGWLVAGNMIGAGIFYTPGLVAGELPGLAWPLGAWALGGVLALCGAAVYAELGARLPHAGGDYRYLAEAFGPLWGFLTGWAGMLLTFSAAAAAMSIVALDYLVAALQLPDGEVLRGVAPPALILALTFANVLGARASRHATAFLTAVPVLGLVALFGAGLMGDRAELAWPESRPMPQGWPLALGAAMLPVYFTYSGWNAASYVAGEVRDPQRSLPWGLLAGTAAVTLLYLSLNLVFLAVIPAAELAGSTTAGAQAARLLLGPAAERALAALIALAVLGSVNVTLMAGSRIYYAMAHDALAPAALARTNEAGVPVTALWAGGLWSAALAVTGTVDLLVNWASLAILLLSSMTVLSLFVLRRRSAGRPPFACPGYPLTPVVYLAASLLIAAAGAYHDGKRSLIGIGVMLLGIPVYALWRRLA